MLKDILAEFQLQGEVFHVEQKGNSYFLFGSDKVLQTFKVGLSEGFMYSYENGKREAFITTADPFVPDQTAITYDDTVIEELKKRLAPALKNVDAKPATSSQT